MTKNIFKNIALAGLGLILASSSFTPTTQAREISVRDLDFVSTSDIGIYPCESEFIEGVSQSRSWILKNAEAGDTIKTCVLVANPTDEAKKIRVGAQSAIPTNDGAISMTSDGQELTGLGSWIDLGNFSGTMEISPGNGRELGFEINIPNNAEPGEYAGAIAVMEVEEDTETSGNFNILRRYGNRIYVSVEPQSEFNLGTKFDTFEFILPGSEMYETYARSARAYKWDDIVMTWRFDTIGNIFTKQAGELTITNPSGETFTKNFRTDYFPNSEVFNPYVSTEAKYTEPGIYKARFEFEHSATIPWNKDADKFEDISPVNFVETEFEVTQEMLDKLKEDKNTLESLLNDGEKKEKEAAQAGGIQGFEKEEELPRTGGQEENNDSNAVMIVAGIAGAVILALIGVIAFILLKKKKEEKEAK